MKLRSKLMLGFGALLALFAAAVAISLFALANAAQGFTQYRGLARDTNLAGRVQANILLSRMHVKNFIISHDPDEEDLYADYYQRMLGYLQTAQQEIIDPERAALVDDISANVERYNTNFGEAVVHTQNIDNAVITILDVVGPQIERNLTAILNSARADGDTEAVYHAAQATRSLLLARLYVFKYLKENLASHVDRVRREFSDMDGHLENLDGELENAQRRELFSRVVGEEQRYLSTFLYVVSETEELNDLIDNQLDVIGPRIADEAESVKLSVMADQNELGPILQRNNQQSVILILIVSGVSLIMVVIITFWTTNSVLRQLGADPGIIETVMKKVAVGDLRIIAEDFELRRIEGVFESVMDMVASLVEKADNLQTVADGDLSVRVQVLGEQDMLGNSLQKMKVSLNELLSQVAGAVTQVNAGAEQISLSSQDLSQGATEQAASIEEITSAITEINSMSRQNAEGSKTAHGLARTAMDNANEGRVRMDELTGIMTKINASADEINKVVKIIDDIAFQINLLALNANVEAARAGKYGKGFAVVAEEVRNLAVRSAQAVKETTKMVEETVSNIAMGDRASKDTNEQLNAIVEGTGKVADLLSEISSSSAEQAQGIDQVNTGLDQIDQTTQANTASAEQSAAASEELAGQAQQLTALIAQFTLDESLIAEQRLLPGPRGSGAVKTSTAGQFRAGDPKAASTVKTANPVPTESRKGPAAGTHKKTGQAWDNDKSFTQGRPSETLNPAETIVLDEDFEDF